MNEDAWRNRPLEVTVFEVCPECNQLVRDVTMRQIWGPYGHTSVFSCLPCADNAEDFY